MLEIRFFSEIDPTPPTDGVFYGIGLAKQFRHEEWRFCEVHLSSREVTETRTVSYSPDELGFRQMVNDINQWKIKAVFAHSSLLIQLAHYAERFNQFTGDPDYLMEPTTLPESLLASITEGQSRKKLH